MFATPRNGTAALHVARVRERSTVISAWARSPLSLLTPRARGESVWAYTSSYGGGMVQGDETRLELKLDSGARCFLSTQASTKIYRNPARRACSHEFQAELDADSLLILAPDPVQCFAESSYEQRQTFRLAETANLVLVDWLSSGRSARGERWAFRRYASKNQIYRGNRTILLDSVTLGNELGDINNRFRSGRFNCLATIAIVGPGLREFAATVLEAIGNAPAVRDANFVFAASPLHEGAIIRLAGVRVEEVGRAIHSHLQFVPSLLQGDPWARKW
jgi:urease accessory protein